MTKAAAASLLEIDLGAIAGNYRRLRAELRGVACACCVKADAYGMGLDRVAPALAGAGCRLFFVATLDEAVALRRTLPDTGIAMLGGMLAGTETLFRDHRLIPVINDLGQLARLRRLCADTATAWPAILHVDTGMNRLGLAPAELDRVADRPDLLDGPHWRWAMSHLACADEPAHEMNGEQLARFRRARDRLPPMPASLANSGGIFLGPDYHFDLARPGIALYGGRPAAGRPNPMRQVIRLLGRVLQLREVPAGMSVGYGAAHRMAAGGRVATIGLGYGDGYVRAAGGQTHVCLGRRRLPVIGRVSMDLIAVDVSTVPVQELRPGDLVEVLGPAYTPDEAADAAGTIGHEFLTGLGRRYARTYVPAPDGRPAGR